MDIDARFISQSRIKWSIIKGEDIKPCPHRLLKTRYTNDVQGLYNNSYQPISPMQIGNYFEEKILGKTAYSDEVIDLKKRPLSNKDFSEHLQEGKKYAAHERMDAHAFTFKRLCEEKEIEVLPQNVQVPIVKKLVHPYTKEVYYFKGITDLFPTTIKNTGGQKFTAIVDIKTTKDVDNTYFSIDKPMSSMACYGKMEELEKIQAHSYLWMIEDFDYRLNCIFFPEHTEIYKVVDKVIRPYADAHEVIFFYWVFGYKNDDLEANRALIPVKYDKGERALFFESVRKCLELEKEYIKNNWPKRPSANNCKGCPMNPKYKGFTDMKCKSKGTAETGAPGDCDSAYSADPHPTSNITENKLEF